MAFYHVLFFTVVRAVVYYVNFNALRWEGIPPPSEQRPERKPRNSLVKNIVDAEREGVGLLGFSTSVSLSI